MNPLPEAFLNTFPAALILVGSVVAALRFTPGVNAATRYAIWWFTLLAVLALPIFFAAGGPESVAFDAAVPGEILPVPEPRSEPLTIHLEPSRTFPTLAVLWLAGACWLMLRLAISYLALRRLKRQATPLPTDSPVFQRRFDLLISEQIASPIAVGFFHPAILFPKQLVASLSPAELDKILIHEYAHLARRDDWFNLLGRALQGVLWFHPLAWFILRRLQLEREIACDDWVVDQTGDARSYASTLLKITELRLLGREPFLATGFLGRKAQLSHRIEKMLGNGRRFVPSISRPNLLLSTVAIALLTTGALQLPGFIQIQPAKEQAKPKAPATEVRRQDPPQGLLASLKAAGYKDIDVDEIIELKNNGISGAYIIEMTALLGKVPTKHLIELHSRNVTRNHIIKAREYKADLTVEQIVRLRNSGVLD